MELPKISLPTYNVTVPSTGKEITMRPMTVKEEKILLMARESGEEADVIKALVQIVNNCIVDSKPPKLNYFDLEWLFLKLRSQSVSNVVKMNYLDPETEEEVEIDVKLDEVEMPERKPAEGKIEIGNIILELDYPNVTTYYSKEYIDGNETQKFNTVIRNTINKIWEDGNVIDPINFTVPQMEEFIDSIPSKNFEDINKFLETQPSMHYEIKYKLKNGDEKSIVLSSLNDFFTF